MRKGCRRPKVVQTKRVRGLWQAHEINEWALKRQVGLKKPGKREIAYLWVVYDVEK